MRKSNLFSISVALALAPLAEVSAEVWTIGVEREVDQGIYATAVQEQDGWRLWRFETKHGTFCKAVKPANGNSQPVPAGHGDMLEGPIPFLMLTRYFDGNLVWDFQAVYPNRSTTEYRKVGSRFFELYQPREDDLTALDGSNVEVNVISYEYPEIFVGRTETAGVFNLTGMREAIRAIDRCEGNEASYSKSKTGSAPKPLGSSSRWFRVDDLPSSAFRVGGTGKVAFVISVSSQGLVSECRIVETSGLADVDEAVCATMAKRAQFKPAVDNDGRPTSGVWESTVAWSIGS